MHTSNMKSTVLLAVLLWTSTVICIPLFGKPKPPALYEGQDSLEDHSSHTSEKPARGYQVFPRNKAAPGTPLAPPTDPFDEVFQFVDTDLGFWDPNSLNVAKYALVEGLIFLHNHHLAANLEDPLKPSNSFLRYLPAKYAASVKTLLSALVLQVGPGLPGWETCHAINPGQLSLKIYYNFGPPGSDERDKCDVTLTHGIITLAYMSKHVYDHKPPDEYQAMVIC